MRLLPSFLLLITGLPTLAWAGDEKKLSVDAFDGIGPKLGASWEIYLDENNLGTKVNPFAIVKDGSPKGSTGHGHFSGHIGKNKEPWPWAALDLAFNDNTPIDLSAYTHLRFYAKGDGKKHRVRLGRDAVKDYCHYEFAFVAPKEWTRITAPLSDFAQPKWGKQIPRGYQDVTMLGFLALAPGNDEDFNLRFTEVEFVALPKAKEPLKKTSLTPADDDNIELKEIGVSLPAKIGDITFKGRQSFDQKALGYSVSYHSRMCAITLIVYDLNEKNIPDGKNGPQVADQMRRSTDDLKTAEKRGLLKNLQGMKGELPLPKSALMTFATAGYTFDTEGGGCKSYILLTGRQRNFLKIRLTQYIVNQKTNDEEINRFLTALAQAVAGK
jgi:hypothetical protein